MANRSAVRAQLWATATSGVTLATIVLLAVALPALDEWLFLAPGSGDTAVWAVVLLACALWAVLLALTFAVRPARRP